jgi:Mg2+ and Co2+ transporter CorA
MTSAAELSSILTGLEDITKRVTAIADAYTSERREDLAGDLYAVERQLVNAARRLGKAADLASR